MPGARFRIVVPLALFTGMLFAGEWRGLTEANHISGPSLKADELREKVVIAVEWGADCSRCAKPLTFVQRAVDGQRGNGRSVAMLASHRHDLPRGTVCEKVHALALSCPVYQDADFSDAPNLEDLPAFYVVDGGGNVLYGGSKAEDAVLAMTAALSDLKCRKKRGTREIK